MTLKPYEKNILDNLRLQYPRAAGVSDEKLLEEWHDFRMTDTDSFYSWLEFSSLIAPL